MRKLLVLLLLVLTGCVETQTVEKPCAAPRVPQCPFGQPVQASGDFHPNLSIGVVVRDQYSIGYSYRFQNPLWACETVNHLELQGTAQRKSSFALDPLLSKYQQAKSSDYTNSGYDRAHLVSAANHLWNQVYMDQTFLMTNISPMKPSFNRGVWRQFEQWVRDWVMNYGDAYVITGALFLPNPRYIYAWKYLHSDIDNPVVPSHFYKIIVSKRGTTSWHAIAFLFDHEEDANEKAPYNWADFVVAVSTIEVMSSLNFMPNLSTTNRERMETKKVNFDLWK